MMNQLEAIEVVKNHTSIQLQVSKRSFLEKQGREYQGLENFSYPVLLKGTSIINGEMYVFCEIIGGSDDQEEATKILKQFQRLFKKQTNQSLLKNRYDSMLDVPVWSNSK